MKKREEKKKLQHKLLFNKHFIIKACVLPRSRMDEIELWPVVNKGIRNLGNAQEALWPGKTSPFVVVEVAVVRIPYPKFCFLHCV